MEREAFNDPIKKVHVIFKTHLDIGFTDLAANVLQTYVRDFIPQALRLAGTMQRNHPTCRFRWTTGSWIIHRFFEAADAPGRASMERAIEAGDICWHGLPFTTHTEALEPSLFDLGTMLSAELDARFGRKTIAAKMTDVPGHTRGIIPCLQRAGIQFLHIGVNPASCPPRIPPVFVWESPEGARVSVMYHAEYGGVMRIPHTAEAVAVVFTGDNQGPQSESDIVAVYEQLRKQFPGAEVVASDLNEIARTIAGIASQLPVVTGELGDSWIHGISSDPRKIADFRELTRLRESWLQSGTLRQGDPTDFAFGFPLSMVAEHTWGLDVKTHLLSWDSYTPEALKKARLTDKFKRMEISWQEKRDFIRTAVGSLPDAMKEQAKAALENLKASPPSLEGFAEIASPGETIETSHFAVALNPATGALAKLQHRKSGRQWASADHPLALFAYQTFSQADYDRYLGQYLTTQPDWAPLDFGKPEIDKSGAISQTHLPRLAKAWIREDDKTCSIIAELAMHDEQGNAILGCPKRLFLEYSLSQTEPTVEVTLQWFEKQANRLPEAMWLSFVPPAGAEGDWVLNKMGQEVAPREVVENGGNRMHAVGKGVRYSDAGGRIEIETLDAPLVAPGERTLLTFDNVRHAADAGMHFCLGNNVWGTNFVMWFDEDMRFRFRLRC